MKVNAERILYAIKIKLRSLEIIVEDVKILDIFYSGIKF